MANRAPVFCLPLLLALASSTPAQQYTFEHYGQEQGLASSLVRAVAQDTSGFLWIGTRAGLFRYDGARFRHFGVADGLPDLHARTLHVTRSGEIWVGTERGIARVEGSRLVKADFGAPGVRTRMAIASDSSNQLFVGAPEGLFVRRPNGQFEKVTPPAGVRSPKVMGVFGAAGDTIWFGCDIAVCTYRNGDLERYGADRGVPEAEYGGFARGPDGTLWARDRGVLISLRPGERNFRRDTRFSAAGTDDLDVDERGWLLAASNTGLWILPPGGGDWKQLTEKQGLPADRIYRVTVDREGSVWLGTADLGLARWRGRGEWENWRFPSQSGSPMISSILRDRGGNLWVGSRDGLATLDPSGQWRRSPGIDDVRALATTPDGAVWVGRSNAGLFRVPAGSRQVLPVRIDPGLEARKILSLYTDPKGKLWVMLREGVYGLAKDGPVPKFERAFGEVLQPREEIYRMRVDRRGRLWLAGNRGLLRRDEKGWTRFETKDGLLSNLLVFLTIGPDDAVWVGYGQYVGLTRMQPDTSRVTHYNTGGPLRSNDICFLETDRRGWIWAGTDNGVDVYNGQRWRHFATDDGLVWHDTVLNAFHEDPDGSVWVGANRGLSHYRPGRATFEAPAPPVAITRARFGRRVVETDARGADVSYRDRSFQIRFTGLSFSRQHMLRFRYRLIGLDSAWVETREREATFPALAPGDYRFEVQAGAGDDWSKQSAVFPFRIAAPWWLASWFQLAAGCSSLLLLGVMYTRRLHRLRHQREDLERAVSERTSELEAQKDRTEQQNQKLELQKKEIEKLLEKAQEASRLKSEFLANMSHEIRTPMNGILGMTELALQTNMSSEQREYLETTRFSGEALLGLLNDILDFSKIEANRLELESVVFSLRSLIEECLRTVSLQARQKGLDLQVRQDGEVPETLIGDPTRLRQILLNLLSNAIKFTQQGWVRLQVELDQRDGSEVILRFHVCDTGDGIPADKQVIIFEAFRQADGTTTRKYGGTGLGLAICARLVSMMGGRIWVSSEPGKGSEFIFTAPLRIAPVPSDKADGHAPHELERLARVLERDGRRKLRVLVAEDNIVNQKLVVRLLEKQGHEVEVAHDGAVTLQLVTQKRFDLILMDVQMPEVDGLETTRRIRATERDSGERIPILMLTANAMVGDREKCIDAGADGYVAKPVHLEKLLQAIEEVTAPSRKTS